MNASLIRSPIDAIHDAGGATMVDFAGWRLPVQYEGVVAEHQAVRSAVGLFDVSHMGEVALLGPGALPTLDRIITNDPRRLKDGRALYTVACNERGGVVDDLIVYRLSEENWLVVCNASNRKKVVAHLSDHLQPGTTLDDRSDITSLLALQGPKSVEVLRALNVEMESMRRFALADASIAGVDCVVARTGYTGEDGFELFAPWDQAASVWAALLKAGEAFGIRSCGLGARDTLRLEAALSLYGQELDDDTTPYEAGLGWVVKPGQRDFLGSEALREAKAADPKRVLVGFRMTGRGVARHGYEVLSAEGEAIGLVTSGSPSPTLGQNIGLAYVQPGHSELGTALRIQVRRKAIDAEVVDTPFYRRNT